MGLHISTSDTPREPNQLLFLHLACWAIFQRHIRLLSAARCHRFRVLLFSKGNDAEDVDGESGHQDDDPPVSPAARSKKKGKRAEIHSNMQMTTVVENLVAVFGNDALPAVWATAVMSRMDPHIYAVSFRFTALACGYESMS